MQMTKILFLFILVFNLTFAFAYAADKQPNVLFIVLDTLRQDYLGCYGKKDILTPHIDSLAKNGVLFENAIAQVPLTFPSHVSFFTSTYPQYNNVRDNGTDFLDPSFITLAEVFKDAGYTTAAFVSSIVLEARYGLNQGFLTYDDKMPPETQKKIIPGFEEERTAEKTTALAIEWLKQNQQKKFFLWVHYYDPHMPYQPPSPYKEMYSASPYAGEIAFADVYIGKLLAELKNLRLEENTLIVFCADHGESLGEHGEDTHAIFVYDATQKVPLIFCYPKMLPQGKRIKFQVRLLDIAPTILDILKIKKPAQFQGESLLGMMLGKEKKDFPAYCESYYAHRHYNWEPLVALRSPAYKYISSSHPELYDLTVDPQELNNILDKQPQIAKSLQKKLEKFLKQTSSRKKALRKEIDRETQAKLLSLGYVSGKTKQKAAVPLEMIKLLQDIPRYVQLANAGFLEEAISGFQKIAEIDPDNPDVYTRLAQCFQHLEKYPEAIKYYKKAAYLRPESSESHNGLGETYRNLGRIDEAIKEFSLANSLEPNNPRFLNNLAWAYQKKGEFAKAIATYTQALSLAPDNCGLYLNLAICYRLQNDFAKARKALEKAKEKTREGSPELSALYVESCALEAQENNLKEAVQYCQKALEISPDNPDAYLNLGACYTRNKEYLKAESALKKVLEFSPWDTQALYNLAIVYLAQKKYSLAKDTLNKILQISPQHTQALNLLKGLK